MEADGEAAFYGPKLDIQAKNVYGKEDTMITIQLDFALAEQFHMYYIDENGEKKMPFIIHRTSMGLSLIHIYYGQCGYGDFFENYGAHRFCVYRCEAYGFSETQGEDRNWE